MSYAVIIAATMVAFTAYAADLTPRFDSMPVIQRCVVTTLTVNGLPLVQHGWCSWDQDQALWVPMSKDLERKRVIDIVPIED